MNNICIIPARGNSKRIKLKNIKLFYGKPIIYWSIKAAIKSKCFRRIVVSTESKKIASIAKKYGAETPFFRPNNLSTDDAGLLSVLQHTIRKLGGRNKIDHVCCVLATAPFINPTEIKRGLKILKHKKIDFVFSATKYNFPTQKCFTIKKDGLLKFFEKKFINTVPADCKKTYHDAAQFYWASSGTFLSGKTVYTGKTFPLIIPSYRSNDINYPEDWRKSELIFQILRKKLKYFLN